LPNFLSIRQTAAGERASGETEHRNPLAQPMQAARFQNQERQWRVRNAQGVQINGC